MRSLTVAATLATLATSALADPVRNKADALAKFLFEKELPANPNLDDLFKSGAVRQREQTVDDRALRKLEHIDAFARCVIVVDGRVLSAGDCTITGHRDAPSFETASGFFGDLGEGDGRWNGEPAAHGSPRVFAAPRAHMSLLGLRRDGQCWVAQTATICINP